MGGCMYVYVCVRMCACVHVCVCGCVHMYVMMWMCVCMYMPVWVCGCGCTVDFHASPSSNPNLNPAHAPSSNPNLNPAHAPSSNPNLNPAHAPCPCTGPGSGHPCLPGGPRRLSCWRDTQPRAKQVHPLTTWGGSWGGRGERGEKGCCSHGSWDAYTLR